MAVLSQEPRNATDSSIATIPSSDPQSTNTSTSIKRRRRMRIHRAAKNSLYDILHDHQGTSLFMRPIFWTDQHSELLGVRFTEFPPCNTPVPSALPGSPPSRGHMRPSQAVCALSEALTEILLPEYRHPMFSSNAVRSMFLVLWPHVFKDFKFMPEMNLYFGGRVYRDAVRCQTLWNFPSESSQAHSFVTVSTQPGDMFRPSPSQHSTPESVDRLPMMCYIAKSQLAMLRQTIFRIIPGPNGTFNTPVNRLYELKIKALIPQNSDQDPHLVAIFLAMAQRHFYGPPGSVKRREYTYRPPEGFASTPKFHDVKLRILSADIDTAEFIVYTATITATFLRRFHTPWSTPAVDESDLGMVIGFTRVPIWPILGLRERLGKALGQDVVGAFDPEEIETWDAEDEFQEDVKRQEKIKEMVVGELIAPCKRKRDGTISESICDEGGGDGKPVISGKKRRLGEAPVLGLVV